MKPKMNVGVKNVARPARFGQRKQETLKAKKIVICFQLVRWHFEKSEQKPTLSRALAGLMASILEWFSLTSLALQLKAPKDCQ